MALWKATLACHDCGAVLNTAEHVPDEDKNHVTIFSAFAAGKCPNGCKDINVNININTKLTWELESQPVKELENARQEDSSKQKEKETN